MKNQILLLSFFMLIVFVGPSSALNEDIQTALLKQDYALAEQLVQKALNAPSEQDDINELSYYLAVSHLRLEKFKSARKILKKLKHQKLEDEFKDKVSIGIFDSYYLDGDYKASLKIAKELIKKRSKSELLSLMYLKYARVNLRLAQWKTARAYLKKIMVQFPDSLEAQAAKGLLEEKQFFAVQVGAFLERSRAEGLVEELNRENEYAYIVERMDQKNKKYYRVRVGQITKLNEAQRLQSKLSRKGYPTRIYP